MRCPYCHEEGGNTSFCQYCGMPLNAGGDSDLKSNETNILEPENRNRGNWSSSSSQAGSSKSSGYFGYSGSSGGSSGSSGRSSWSSTHSTGSSHSSYSSGSSSYSGSQNSHSGGPAYSSGPSDGSSSRSSYGGSMNPQSDIPSMQEKKNQEREKKRQAERGKEGKKKRSILWSIFTVVTIAIAGAIGRSCANAMFHTSSPYVSTPHTSSPSTTSIDYMEQAMNSLKSGRIQTDLANRSDQLNTEFTILEGKIGAAFTE